jgi:HEAT repeat protein
VCLLKTRANHPIKDNRRTSGLVRFLLRALHTVPWSASDIFSRELSMISGSWYISIPLVLSLLGCPAAAAAQTQPRQVPVESLIYDLKNPDPVRRKEAAMSLGNNKVQRATPDLVAAAGDADAAVRREMVIALDKMLDIRSLPAFVKLSGDSEREIREKCIHGMLNLYLPQERGLTVTVSKVANFFNPWSDEWADIVVEPGIRVDPEAISSLRDRLKEDDDGLRSLATRSLGILKGRAALPAIAEVLRQDRNNNVRFEAARALRKIGDASAAKDLMNFIGYTDIKVRNECIYALGRLRDRDAVPELTKLYQKESELPAKLIDNAYREFLLDAISFIAEPASADLFKKETQSPIPVLRLHALEGLARIGDPSLVTDISRDRLKERDPKIQATQAFALYRMGRKEYLDELLKALKNRKTNQLARQYLVEFRPDELPDLYPHVKDDDTNVREGLAETFGLIGGREAIPFLQQISQDGRGQTAALANQAIRRINGRLAER